MDSAVRRIGFRRNVRSFNRASLSSPRFKRLLFQVVSCVGHAPFRSRFIDNPLHALV